MTATTPLPPAGWYPDAEPGRLRFHDGTRWTSDTMPVPRGETGDPGTTPAPASSPPTQVPATHGQPTHGQPTYVPPTVLAGAAGTEAPARRGLGMSWWSVAAVFLAVLTLVLWGLSLPTGLVGVAAVAREKRQGTNQVLYGGLAIGAAVVGRVLARATEEPTLLAWL